MIALVLALTRAWVRSYTRGLPAAARDTRRSEIESDVWEQRRAEHARGRRPLATALGVLGRVLRGVPADLAWRLEQRTRGRLAHRLRAGARSAGRHGWTVFPAFVALGYVSGAAGLGTPALVGTPAKLAMAAGAAAIVCGVVCLWRGTATVAAAWLVCAGALVPACLIASSAPLALLWALLAMRSALRRADALRAQGRPVAPV